MDSHKKDNKDSFSRNTDDSDESTETVPYDPKLDQWDEWYDTGELQNKNSKIRRSKKRLYKQRDEW